jgi:uncharacterized delta-60 repeat protein
MKRRFFFLAILFFSVNAAISQDGVLDPTFNAPQSAELYPFGADDLAYEICAVTSNRFLIGGDFLSYNNRSSPYICKIDSNGVVDQTFQSNLQSNFRGIKKIVTLSDGKILIGGSFGVARLLSNGRLDSSFNVNGSGANGTVSDILSLPNQKIIIAGRFTGYNNFFSSYIACLNQNGSFDPTFNVGGIGFDYPVNALTLTINNKILAGGQFFIYNGHVSQYLIQLNLNGSVDSAFTPIDIYSQVLCLKSTTDGKLFAGGDYGVVKLKENGSADSSFNAVSASANLSGPVNKIKLLPNGFILLASGYYDMSLRETLEKNIFLRNSSGNDVGTFQYFIPDNTEHVYQLETTIGGKLLVCNKIYDRAYRGFGVPAIYHSALPTFNINRYNSDGSIDYTFNTNPSAKGANKIIRAVAQQTDGKTIVGGSFYYYNGQRVNRLMRMNVDGSIDNTFQVGAGPDKPVLDIAIQADGKILLAGFFNSYNGYHSPWFLRLNNNGTLDTSFTVNLMANGVNLGYCKSICIKKNGMILLGQYGRLFQFDQNGFVDNNFNVTVSNSGIPPEPINTIIETNNNKLIFGGWFESDYSTSIFNSWARLNPDGSPDSSLLDEFGYNNNSSYYFDEVFSVAEQADSKILLGHYNLDRLLPNGQLDTSFHRGFGFNGNVNSIKIQPDGKILVGGSFTSYNGAPAYGLARLFPDGTLDLSYQTSPTSYVDVREILIPSNVKNRILIYGDFTSIQNQINNRIARLINCITSYDTVSVCAPQFPYIINGISYASTGAYNQNIQTIDGCDSILTILLTAQNNRPATPSSITQTLVSNLCGERVFRYTASTTIGALGYKWVIPQTINGVSGITLDSGDANSSKIIRLKYSSNLSSAITDSIKVSAYNGCGTSLVRSVKLNVTALNPPLAPARITVQSVTSQQCGYRSYRYIAPNLTSATINRAAATGWKWEFIGSLAEFLWVDSGDINSQVILVTFTSNAAAGIGDSIKLSYISDCGYGLPRSIKMTNRQLKVPTAPASIIINALETNICGYRRYRYSAPALPVANSISGAATGYVWDFIGSLGSNAVIDSGSLNSQKFTVIFSSNSASSIRDSVRVYFTSDCGNSLRRSLKLSNTLLNPPLAPASITMTLVRNDCGVRVYRYSAPLLPAATTVNGAATGYAWTMPFGPLGSQGTLDSGSFSSRTIRIVYSTNQAASTGDSIRVRYQSGCGLGLNRTMKLSNTIKTGCPPITKTSVPFAKNNPQQTAQTKLTVALYPNPSTQYFSLKLNSVSVSAVQVSVYDMLGKLIKQMQLQSNSSTEFGNEFKPGVYQLHLLQDGDLKVIRAVKY